MMYSNTFSLKYSATFSTPVGFQKTAGLLPRHIVSVVNYESVPTLIYLTLAPPPSQIIIQRFCSRVPGSLFHVHESEKSFTTGIRTSFQS